MIATTARVGTVSTILYRVYMMCFWWFDIAVSTVSKNKGKIERLDLAHAIKNEVSSSIIIGSTGHGILPPFYSMALDHRDCPHKHRATDMEPV